MPNVEILIKLRDLHEELTSINDDLKMAERVDEETIDALGQLVTDVGALVDQAKECANPGFDESERHILMDRITGFESDHPRVTRVLAQINDVVAMIGV